ncbi:DNA topoisomerase 3-alpha isoform X2 [Eupeodes corollae]|uniref:DNA topoisomerase 3-alpha isoform X2 n=1 Tax=Eupeodes corollae TaxID=290404 RepID=UPI002491D374|nr:DNA topoisomerase 3-alpha isoform X2 [Eupeodes corollae]
MFKICPNLPKIITAIRFIHTKSNKEMKYLNVAEKNDAAKTIAGLLSNGSARRREGLSVYNKIYEFETPVRGNNSKMVMTSVSGHLLGAEFLVSYKNWKNCDPLQLFDAPIRRTCIEDYLPIKKTLEREIKSCQGLIIWTDCDREGESIGFEIIEVCRAIKPNITVYRAKFSEITTAAVRRALANLEQPNKFLDNAVTARSELDLRTGAALTRLQTMRLQRLFPEKIANKLISYGSCQIPTLGFVVERYKEVEAFVSEPFWKIKVTHEIDDLTVEFNWARNRLFDKETCEDYLMLCLADPKAKVENVTTKPKNKWRPTPMDTVDMEKLGSRKLKLSAKETMTIAEKLYTQGIISYPRTETNMFSKEIDLRNLVEQHVTHSDWGQFASRILEWGPNPRNGNKTDQAHPPIHPTKMVTHLNGNEGRVYELIVRHFLACVSKDATGSETVVNIDIASEKFNATGLCIYERNYLDVYVYDKWNAKQIHKYEVGQIFDPTEISMQEGATTAPPLLTEADLIALMEKHGIGTDATHADHINTIKERGYIGEADRGCLVPGVIGMGLFEAYDAMELVLAKPMLRAEFESDLKKICLGQKDPKLVLQEQIHKYKEAYKVMISKITAMDEKIAQRINETPVANTTNEETNASENQIKELFNCPKCQLFPMALRKKKTSGFFIGCLNFPDCKNAVWLPDELKDVSALDENCRRCGTASKMLKVKLSAAYYRSLFNVPDGWYTTCLRCDSKFRETFNINSDQIKQVGRIVGDTSSVRRNNTTGVATNPVNNHARENIPSNTNTSSGSAGTSSEATNTNGNKTQRKTKPLPLTKKSSKKPDSQTSIRNFTTNAQCHTTTELGRQVENVSDFFGSNDEFDDILGSVDFENVIQENPRNSIIASNEAAEVASLLSSDDWDDMSWGSSNRNVSITNQPKRIRVESLESHSSTSGNSQERNWRPEVRQQPSSTSTYQWGSSSSQKNSIRNENEWGSSSMQRNNLRNESEWGSSSTHRNNTNESEWGSSSTHRINRNESNQPSSSSRTISSQEVKCTGCHLPAIELTVKKDGPNKGRPFYKCPKTPACNFFQWSDECEKTETPSAMQNRTVNREGPSSSKASVKSQEMCNCKKPANKLIVRKEGPNNGRWFYGCADRSKSCGFFKWCENDDSDTEQQYQSSWGSNPSTSAAFTKTKRPGASTNNRNDSSSSNDVKKRKCGLCRQEGHTRSKCPRKAEFDI